MYSPEKLERVARNLETSASIAQWGIALGAALLGAVIGAATYRGSAMAFGFAAGGTVGAAFGSFQAADKRARAQQLLVSQAILDRLDEM